MDTKNLIPRLQFHSFRGKFPPPEWASLLDEAFGLWHDVFTSTLKELEGTTSLSADDFLRQDEKTVLTADGKVIAFLALDWMDLDLASHREHSYFSSFPREVFSILRDKGLHRIVTVGNLCVHPDWRRGPYDHFAAKTMATLGFRRGKESWADGCIAITRNDRKINDICCAVGLEKIALSTAHGLAADIVCAPKAKIHDYPDPVVNEIIQAVWAKRLIHEHTPTFQLRRVA